MKEFIKNITLFILMLINNISLCFPNPFNVELVTNEIEGLIVLEPKSLIYRVDLDMINRTLHCSHNYKLINTKYSSISSINLYSGYPMSFEEIRIDDEIVNYDISDTLWQNKRLTIIKLLLPKPLKINESINVNPVYTVKYPEDYRYHRKAARIDSLSAYIMMESEWYVRWKPDFIETNYPFTIYITVLADQFALAPGKLIEKSVHKSTITYVYKNESAFTPFIVSRNYFTIKSATDSEIPVNVYLPKDGNLDADHLISFATKAISFYKNNIDVKIRNTFNIVAVKRIGGYGPPGILLLNDNYFSSSLKDDLSTFQVVAHEAAHSWIGGIAKPSGKNKFTLSEGLADYLAIKTIEHFLGEDKEIQLWKELQSNYEENEWETLPPSEINWDIQIKANRMFRAVIYSKGAFLWRMLEQKYSSKTIFTSLSRVLSSSTDGSFTINDIKSQIEILTGNDLTSYFDQLLNTTDLPDYQIIDVQPISNNSIRTYITNNGSQLNLPVEVTLYNVNDSRFIPRIKTIEMNGKDMTIIWNDIHEYSEIIVDPDYKILQTESRNDYYPTSFINKEEKRELDKLLKRLITAINNQDTITLDSLLIDDLAERNKLISIIESGILKNVITKNYRFVKIETDKIIAISILSFVINDKDEIGRGLFNFQKQNNHWYFGVFGIRPSEVLK